MKERARCLRKNLTDAEIKLWVLLRNKKFHGFKFRRQYWIGPYIVDFICLCRDLVVEVDGSQHLLNKQYDKEREKYLIVRGFRVVRFWNDEVLKDTEVVLSVIYKNLIERPHPSFRDTLSRRRERGNYEDNFFTF